jgi:hypothetical protein
MLLVIGSALTLTSCGGGSSPSAAPTTDVFSTSAPDMPTVPTTTAPISSVAPPPTATTPPPPVASVTTAAAGCPLPHTGDLIWWENWPGTDPQVSMLGDVDITKCKYTVDTFADTEPTGPGYCDILARPADNPSYDMNAVPPARPAHFLLKVGDGC